MCSIWMRTSIWMSGSICMWSWTSGVFRWSRWFWILRYPLSYFGMKKYVS
jgi:hypothetical protein